MLYTRFDNNSQNPAELNTVNTFQVIAGTVFINPVFEFNGISYGVNGNAKSKVTDYLPYVLGAFRLNDPTFRTNVEDFYN